MFELAIQKAIVEINTYYLKIFAVIALEIQSIFYCLCPINSQLSDFNIN